MAAVAAVQGVQGMQGVQLVQEIRAGGTTVVWWRREVTRTHMQRLAL